MKTIRNPRRRFVLLCTYVLSLMVPFAGCGGDSSSGTGTAPVLSDEVKAEIAARKQANAAKKAPAKGGRTTGVRK